MTHLTGSAGHPSDNIVEGLRITIYPQLAHTGRDEDTALVTDDGIVKLFENGCGAVNVSGRCGER
jgi:cytosine/adenosine deaminase-related metal-dependent hydrolase